MEDVEGYEYIFKNIGGFFGELISTIAIICIIFFLIASIILIISYIFKSIGLYKLQNNKNIKYGWLAWLPVLNNTILSKLSFNNYYIGVIMCVLIIIRFLTFNKTNTLDIIGNLSFIVYIVLNVICAYKIYRNYSMHYKAMTIFSSLTLGFTIPFMLYAIKNNTETVNIKSDKVV